MAETSSSHQSKETSELTTRARDKAGGDGGSQTIATIRAIVGLASVVVAATYMCGAIILAGQMLFADLPPIGVVGAVPRENAVATGASLVIGPAILAGIAYAVARSTFFPGREAPGRFKRFDKVRKHKDRALAGWIVELVVLIGVFAGPPIYRYVTVQSDQSWWWLVISAISVTAVVSALGFLHGRARAAEKWPRKEWSGVAPVSAVAAVLAAATVPSLAAFWAVGKLPDAVVCLRAADGQAAANISGLFIGQTSDRVYLGAAESEPRAFRTFPSDVVDHVVVGETGTESCAASNAAEVPTPMPTTVLLQPSPALEESWQRHHDAHERAWHSHHRATRQAPVPAP